MKILMINTFYWPKITGGAEISVQLLAEGLAEAGHEVYVLTTGATDKVYSVNGVVVISWRQRNLMSTFDGISEAPGQLKALWHMIDSANVFYHFKLNALLKKLKPDIVNTHNIQGFSPSIWFTIKKQNITLVHTLRDYYLLCHKCNLFNNNTTCEHLCSACNVTYNIKSKFAGYPDVFVGISKHILNVHDKYLPIHNSKVIYNAASSVVQGHVSSTPAVTTFGYLGRLKVEKGLDYLATEIAQLDASQRSCFQILFGGEGSPELIKSLKGKLSGINFEFCGKVDPADFYSRIDVLIVPALWDEPFGRTVIESVANNVPVCQSDRGALKEIHDPKSGWMFSPYKGVLATLLSRILNNPEEIAEKRKNCAKRAAQFSVSANISKYKALYDQLVYSEAGKADEVTALHPAKSSFKV